MTGCILLLDDSEELTSVMCESLELIFGKKAIVAHSLQELQTKATEAIRCGIALIDINLGPEQPTGIDALRWLRETGFRGRVYFLTGHAVDHPLVREASLISDVAILSKPIGFDTLEELLVSP
jgi:DNA-binding NtrC family response regulator